jgi:hypothetical protein
VGGWYEGWGRQAVRCSKKGKKKKWREREYERYEGWNTTMKIREGSEIRNF